MRFCTEVLVASDYKQVKIKSLLVVGVLLAIQIRSKQRSFSTLVMGHDQP